METTETLGRSRWWMEECLQCMLSWNAIAAISTLTMLQFVEYDHRAHKLVNLASFSFWVASKLPLPTRYSTRIC